MGARLRRRNGGISSRKSPLRRAIEKYTGHPAGEGGGCPEGRSKLLHWIHVITQHPNLVESRELPRHGDFPSQSVAAVLVGLGASALLSVAAEVMTRKFPGLQATFQSKWSKLETMLCHCLAASHTRLVQAGGVIRTWQQPTKHFAKRALPLVVLSVAATALSHTKGKEATEVAVAAHGSAGAAGACGRVSRTLHCCLAIAGCAAAQCAVTHRPALGAKDSYKVARARLMTVTKHASKGLSRVVTSRKTHRIVYTAIGCKALQQGVRHRRLMFAPAALASLCAEAAVRGGTDREVTLVRQHVLPALRAANERFQAERERVHRALRDFLQAGREYCLMHPDHTRAAEASMLFAALLATTVLQRRHAQLRMRVPGSTGSTPGTGAASAESKPDVSGAVQSGEQPAWLDEALSRLQGGAAALGHQSEGFLHRMQEAGAAMREQAVPVLQSAGSAVLEGTHGAAAAVPEQLQHLVETLGALLADSPADESAAVDTPSVLRTPKGLDGIAAALLSPELLVYGMVLSEMHMQGSPPRRAQREAANAHVPNGWVFNGRDVKNALMHVCHSTRAAVTRALDRVRAGGKGTPAAVAAEPKAAEERRDPLQAERDIQVPDTASPRTPSAWASGSVASVSTPPQQVWRTAPDSELEAVPKSQLDANAFGKIPHVTFANPEEGDQYQGSNPTWMLSGLAAAGVLPPDVIGDTSISGSRPQKHSWLLEQQSWMAADKHVKRQLVMQDRVGKLTQDVPTSLDATQMRKLFELEEGLHHLNHGSYGATLRPAQEAAEIWRQAIDASPSRFFEEDAVPCLVQAVAAAADLLHVSPCDCVPVENATAGITTLLHSLKLRRGDALLVMSLAYPAIKTAVGRTAQAAGAVVLELELDLECAMDPALAVERLRTALQAAGGSVCAVVMDHVVSFPPIVLPVQKMAAVCREMNAISIVDGAHAIGNVDIDIGSLKADAYVTNLHKWLCTPKGTALLWVSKEVQATVKPLVASHGAGLGFVGEHIWSGTTDLAPWLAVPTAVDMHQKLGVKAQGKLRQSILEEGVAALLKAFEIADTSVPLVIGGATPQQALSGKGSDVHVDCNSFPSMAAVRLPHMANAAVTPAAAQQIRSRLRHEYSVEAPVVAWQDCLWVRVSAAVYNCTADYEALAEAVLAMNDSPVLERTLSPLQSFVPTAVQSAELSESQQMRASQAVTDRLVGYSVDHSDAGLFDEHIRQEVPDGEVEEGCASSQTFSAQDHVTVNTLAVNTKPQDLAVGDKPVKDGKQSPHKAVDVSVHWCGEEEQVGGKAES